MMEGGKGKESVIPWRCVDCMMMMKQATRQCYDVCQYEVILQHRSEHRSEGEMRNEGRHDSMMNRDGGETLRVGPSAWMLEPAGRTLDGHEND